MKAWITQRNTRKQPWCVQWRDREGKLREKSFRIKKHAEGYVSKKTDELERGVYGIVPCDWSEFRDKYRDHISSTRKPSTAATYETILNRFTQIAKPKRVDSITAEMIDRYAANRIGHRGAKSGSTVSRSTVNSELRTIKAAIRVANRWNHIYDVPRIALLKEIEKEKRCVSEEHFTAIFDACDVATRPELPYCDAPTWWRALLGFMSVTGWRIGETLRLLRADVDLDVGEATTRGEHNKGGRDETIPLHPWAVTLLRDVTGFEVEMFPWPHGRRRIWDEFHAIQRHAGICLPCGESHDHDPETTQPCQLYGFHDIRRAFATLTGRKLDADTLQKMMRHKSYSTTQRYIQMRERMKGVTEKIAAPTVLNREAAG